MTGADAEVRDRLSAASPPPEYRPAPGWKFRYDIEGLRGVAVILVIAYHLGYSWAIGGFLGVDVFFVISGFLITGMLVNEGMRTGRVDLASFWARRARRLIPAATLVTVAALLMTALIPGPFAQIYHAKTALAVAGFSSNLLFLRRGADYFASDSHQDLLLHTWSLSIEEQFYVLFAPAVWVLFAVAAEKKRRIAGKVLVMLALGVAASLLWYVTLSTSHPLIAFYTIPARTWEFAMGALVYLFVTRVPHTTISLRTIVSMLGLGGLICAVLAARWHAVGPLRQSAVAAVGSTALLIVSGGGTNKTLAERVLGSWPFRGIGRLSYSWYLWHWPLAAFAAQRFGLVGPSARLLVLLTSFGFALVTYHVIERPARTQSRLFANNRRALVSAIALSGVVTLVSLIVIVRAQSRISSPALAGLRSAHSVLPRSYADGCHVDLAATVPSNCAYGATGSDTIAVLFGDSHAAQWLPALETERSWRIIPMTKSSCPSVWVTVEEVTSSRAFTECNVWREAALRRILEIHPSFVLITNFHGYSIDTEAATLPMKQPRAAVRAWIPGLARTIAVLGARGIRVVVLRDSPFPDRDLLDCLAGGLRAQECSVSRSAVLDSAYASAESTVVSALGHAFVDLTDLLCTQEECVAEAAGLPVYRDAHHLSVVYAAAIGPVVTARIRAALESRGP